MITQELKQCEGCDVILSIMDHGDVPHDQLLLARAPSASENNDTE